MKKKKRISEQQSGEYGMNTLLCTISGNVHYMLNVSRKKINMEEVFEKWQTTLTSN